MATPAKNPPPVQDPPQPSPPRRRRRVLRWLIGIVVLLLLVVAGDAGAGWYFSDQVLHIDQSSYPVTVRAVDGNTVTLSRDAYTVRPIEWGLNWADGHAVLDSQVRVDGDHVVRTVRRVTRGALSAGLHVAVHPYVYAGDPASARSMDFDTVSVPSELGDLPAWYVPPARTGTDPDTDTGTGTDAGSGSDTWVVAVHGRGGSREEALRILPTLAGMGLSTLVISYRTDDGAPAGPDHWYHLGDTEWRDVDAAVAYAQAHGAHRIVLYGWSMGGGMVLTALHRMAAAQVAAVKAVVVDSPVLDWTATLDQQGRNRNLPPVLTWTAERIVERRAGFRLDAVDQLRSVASLTAPMLVFVDLADSTVPVGPALRLADARPDLVKLVTTAGGEHTGSWNADPASYERAVRDFLTTN